MASTRTARARYGTVVVFTGLFAALALVVGVVLATMRSPDLVVADSGEEKGQGHTLHAAVVGQEWDKNGLKMVFCWCPPGRFTMGSPKGEGARSRNEDQVEVHLTRGFWLGKFEVTQAQWNQALGDNPSDFSATGSFKADVAGMKTGEFPVEQVSWRDAVRFCRKFTEQERQAGRLPAEWEYCLPTEAQWEYACRAGTDTATAFGGALSSREANFDGHLPYNGAATGPNLKRPTSVGCYSPNAWGIHDMHGNVWEWCRDGFAESLPGGADPEIAAGENRVTRGGAWNFTGWLCRSANRGRGPPDYRFDHLGFRVAVTRSNNAGALEHDNPQARRMLNKINENLASSNRRGFRVETNSVNQVMRIDASNSDMPPSALAHVRGLHSLEGLELGGTSVTDGDMKHLADLTSLRWLYLDDTIISDAGLAHLKALAQMEVVALSQTRVTGPGLAHLTGMTNLRALNISGCRINDRSLRHIAAFTQLETLAIQNTPVRGPGLGYLNKLRRLNVLNLNQTRIEGDYLLHLLGSQQLRILHMKGTTCSAASKGVLQNSVPALQIYDR